jgi:mannose-6-phosphate isomerase-like protein (cupin superfamily)
VGPPTVLRVRDAPNWAESRFGVQRDKFEMRILRDVLGCEHVGVSYLRFGPGWRSSVGHRHPTGEEIYVLVEGRARMKIEDEILTLEAPSAVRVRGEHLRAIRPLGDAPAVFVVAGYPIDDPDKTEIIPNFWAQDE